MTRNDKNKIDRLLLNYYREEASRLNLPDSQRCWQDFQKLLEQNSPDNIDMAISSPPADAVTLKSRIYRFAGRYRNIAAAAAACFLVVMLLSGMPPVQMLRQVLTGTLPEMQVVGTEDKAAQEFVLQTQPPEPSPAPLPLSEKEVFAVKATEEVRELVFNSLQAYRTALREHASLAPGKLFYLAAPPGGYTFSRAAIYKTGTSLHGVRQEFSDAAGNKLILRQEFAAPFAAKIPPETAEAAAQQQPETGEEAAAYSIGGITYAVSMENGLITLQYSLDNSVLMLTAAIDEERLRHIAAQLAVFGQ